jgi:DNA-binding MarR family transcriptional regulator
MSVPRPVKVFAIVGELPVMDDVSDRSASLPSDSFERSFLFRQQLWRLNHALEQLSSRMGRHLGVTAQQLGVLRCIALRPGLRPGELAKTLRVDRGTVSAALGRLEAKGLVERRRGREDLRLVSVWLTADAAPYLALKRGTVEAALERWLDEVPADDIERTAGVLGRLSLLLHEEAEVAGLPSNPG